MDSSDVNAVCSFSDDTFCLFQNQIVNTSSFQWHLYNPTSPEESIKTPSSFMSYDHTSSAASSGYAYVEATTGAYAPYPATPDAKFTTQVYEPPATVKPKQPAARCLEFYYNVQGDNVVELSISYWRSYKDGYKQLSLWSRQYDHGASWWKAEVDVSIDVSYYLEYSARVLTASSVTGFAALDDITLRDGQCSG